MKKLIFFVLALCLLVGCGEKSQVEQQRHLALEARGQYLSLERGSAVAEITADYGERIYDFSLVVTLEGDVCKLTVTAPEEVAGISVSQVDTGEGTRLEWDGVMLETGNLSPQGLTPITAVPALITALKSGFVDSATLKSLPTVASGSVLELFCRDPQNTPGTGTEYVLWLEPENYLLLGGEIYQDGHRVISCRLQDFLMS